MTGPDDKLVLLEMDSVAVTVPLRPPAKKMKKRKELDALAPQHVVSRRSSGKRSSQVRPGSEIGKVARGSLRRRMLIGVW